MQFEKITVIGLGLIGGSLARALKDSGQVEIVVGIDTNEDTLKYAFDNGVIDEGASEINEVIEHSEIIVIATYVGSICEGAKKAFNVASDGAIITDVGSVKSSVIDDIEKHLPENLHFVPAHPIAGTENSGIRSSNPGLFKDKRCIITPTPKTLAHAVDKVRAMWELAGSDVYEMDPGSHDHIFAVVSHLPHVVAYSLINTVLSDKDSEKLLEFAGGGLKDYTRVSASSPEMWTEIFKANKDELLSAISLFRDSLSKIEGAIKDEDLEKLTAELEKAAQAKRNL